MAPRSSHPPLPARVVFISIHTSPFAQAGSGDAGGLNIYVDALSRRLAELGVGVDVVTTDLDAPNPTDVDTSSVLPDGRRVHTLTVCEKCRENRAELVGCLDDICARAEKLLKTAEEPIDLLHSHYWISGLAAIQLADSLKVPFVHTFHTVGAVKAELDAEAGLDMQRHRAEERIGAAAALVTANTDLESQDLHRTLGIPRERISVLTPGTDTRIFTAPAIENDPRRTPAVHRGLVLGFAGRLQKHKGAHIAVAVTVQLRRHLAGVMDVKLHVAGKPSGPETLDLHAVAQEHGISDALVHYPPLPHQDLAEFFRACDVILVPSRSESFGFVALEAQACGTPVIAHRVGGLVDIVDDQRNGLLADSLDPGVWADAIGDLVTDWTRWQAMSAAAAEAGRRRGWTETAQRCYELYSELLAA